jgi:hypothetical protein
MPKNLQRISEDPNKLYDTLSNVDITYLQREQTYSN